MNKNQFKDLVSAIKEAAEPAKDSIWTSIENNGFKLSPEAHEEAKKMVASLKGASTYDYPNRLYALHHHLQRNGVDINHPHMQSLYTQADDAEHMNRDKARARAGL